MDNTNFEGYITLIGFFAIMFLPTIIAICRKHPHTFYIFLVNLLFRLVGWIIGMIWVFINFDKNKESK